MYRISGIPRHAPSPYAACGDRFACPSPVSEVIRKGIPMDPAAFDALSRSLGGDSSRRALLARLAGGLTPLLSFALREDAAARKKRRRKRKRKKDRCPAGLVACDGQCGLPDFGQGCLFDGLPCCSKRCSANACFPCPGKPCAADDDCCRGLSCLATASAGPTCGGCLSGNIGTCQSADDCCSAECNSGVCLSRLGEHCATRLDCMGLPGWAPDCLGGTCICPRECCEDTDCTPPKVCRNGACTCLTGECCFDADCAPAEQCLSGQCQPGPAG